MGSKVKPIIEHKPITYEFVLELFNLISEEIQEIKKENKRLRDDVDCLLRVVSDIR